MILLSLLCLHLLIHSSHESCSISRFSRKTCSRSKIYLSSKNCLAAGCCFDERKEIPSRARCYKKSSSGSLFSLFEFSATKPPSHHGNINVYSYGGSADYPGSQVMLICDLTTLCKHPQTYRNQRGECVRKGCCWRLGKCFENKIRILHLRDSCPPGHKNPPKCEAIKPCDENPCLNGGVCIPDGSTGYTCKCQDGFGGDICEPSNCKILPASLPNVIIEPSSTSDGYKNGTIINLKCEPDYEAVFGSEPTRTCLNGQISPSLITSTFECSKFEPKVDFLMVFSSSNDLDNCGNLASKLGTPPYTQSQLTSVNAMNFILQLQVLEQIETLYKLIDNRGSQFAYYANEKPCAVDDLKRSLSQTNLIDTSSLLQAQKYTCSSENLLDIIICGNEYTYTPVQDNIKNLNVMIYVNGGDSSSPIQYIQLAQNLRNNPNYASYLNTVIIVLDYLPRSSPFFNNNQIYFSNFIGETNFPFKGKFIGSIHDPIDTIMDEIKKVVNVYA